MKKYLLTNIGLSIVILFVLLGGSAFAATSWFVHNDEPMVLKNSISRTETSITLVGPRRNGSYVVFQTQTGGILEFRSSDKVELIYYSSATVTDNSTKDVTLAGVVRGYCWRNAIGVQTFDSCEDGQIWPKSTRVILVNDMRLFNMAAKLDLVNVFQSGASIHGTMTGRSLIRCNSLTTTERDAIVSADLGNGDCIYNTTTGQINYREGGAWSTLGGTGSAFATLTSSGNSEQGSGSDLTNATATGDSGGPIFIPTSLALVTSDGARTNSGRAIVTNSVGVADASIGGTGTGGTTGMGSGGILMTQSGSIMKAVYPGTNGNVIQSNGTEWISDGAGDISGGVSVKFVSVALSTATGASNTTVVFSDQSYTIPADSLAAGDVIIFEVELFFDNAVDGNLAVTFNLGGTEIVVLPVWDTVNVNLDAHIQGMFTVRSIGASGTIAAVMSGLSQDANSDSAGANGTVGGTKTVDTTAGLELKIGATFSTDQAGNTFQTNQFVVTKYSAP